MMTSLLHQLENNEAILLMYLADELPAEDRADVEQQLASDPALRAELDELRGVQESFAGTMERLDVETRLPVSESVAVRRATRMLRQWQVDHVNGAVTEEEPIKELGLFAVKLALGYEIESEVKVLVVKPQESKK